MTRLDGRTALVTGASSGLGARFAATLHRAGCHVALTARREDRLRRLADDLGGRTTVLPGDLRSPQIRAHLVDTIAERSGRLDILVNNAGVCDDKPLHDQSLQGLTDVLDLNLVAAVDLCRLAAPMLFAARGASVINVSSIYGLVGSREPLAAYNASKGALVNLTATWPPSGVVEGYGSTPSPPASSRPT